MQQDIDTLDFHKLLNFIKTLREIDTNKQHSIWENWLKENLPTKLPLFANLICKDNFRTVKRITVNKIIIGENRRIHNISQLSYPPDPETQVKKYGRANMRKQSIFYGTFNPITAMNEVGPNTNSI